MPKLPLHGCNRKDLIRNACMVIPVCHRPMHAVLACTGYMPHGSSALPKNMQCSQNSELEDGCTTLQSWNSLYRSDWIRAGETHALPSVLTLLWGICLSLWTSELMQWRVLPNELSFSPLGRTSNSTKRGMHIPYDVESDVRSLLWQWASSSLHSTQQV